MIYFATFIITLVMTITVIPTLTQFADRLQLVDRPGDRKVHVVAIPRVGGIGMVLSILVPVLLWAQLDRTTIAFLVGVLTIAVFGIWDDRGDLDYRVKFLGQVIAACVVVIYGDVTIKVFPFFGLDPVSPFFYYPMSVFVIVAVTNAINLADGLDGLAAGMMMLSLAGVAILATLADGNELVMVVLAVMGSIAGFLRFNTYPARIFMGDTGSQFLGFTTCTLMIMLTQQFNAALNPAVPLLLLGVPVFDTLFVMTKRISHGISPFSPDKNHIHHQLLALNFDHYEAVIVIYLVQAIFVFTGILLRFQSDLVVVGSWLVANAVLATTLILAGRSNWRAHNAATKSGFARFAESGFRERLHTYSLFVLRVGVTALLVVGPLFASPVEPETGAVATVMCVLLLLRLIVGNRFWFINLRLILYTAAAFVVYLLDQYLAGVSSSLQVYEYVYIAIIAAALLAGAFYRTDDSFTTTPTDYLIVLLMLGAVLVPNIYGIGENMAPIAVKLVIMFYAIEVLLQRLKGRWTLLPLAALWAFSVISARGFGLI